MLTIECVNSHDWRTRIDAAHMKRIKYIAYTQLPKVVNGTHLYTIDVANNSLRHIFPDMFSFPPNVVTIDLRCNKLRVIHSHAFRHLQYLTQIHLLKNNLIQVKSFSFVDLPRVISINLSSMHISEFASNSFILKSLVSLDLSYNAIATINLALLNHLPNISLLDIRGNRIDKFYSKAEVLPFINIISELDYICCFGHCKTNPKHSFICPYEWTLQQKLYVCGMNTQYPCMGDPTHTSRECGGQICPHQH